MPGTLTSAYLALQLFAPGVKTLVVPFDRILEEVREGRADVGLVIHEGQLTYGGEGLVELARPRRVVEGRDRPAPARSAATPCAATSGPR